MLPVDPPRRATFAHATAFVAGFSVVFVVLGASLGVVGFALQDQMIWFQRVAGVALIILGLHLAELITIPFLWRTYQFGADGPPPAMPVAPRGRLRKYGHSLFVGSAFSLGWTPCVGPILAGILDARRRRRLRRAGHAAAASSTRPAWAFPSSSSAPPWGRRRPCCAGWARTCRSSPSPAACCWSSWAC